MFFRVNANEIGARQLLATDACRRLLLLLPLMVTLVLLMTTLLPSFAGLAGVRETQAECMTCGKWRKVSRWYSEEEEFKCRDAGVDCSAPADPSGASDQVWHYSFRPSHHDEETTSSSSSQKEEDDEEE